MNAMTRIKWMTVACMTIASVVASQVSASLVIKDSADFDNKWEGGTNPVEDGYSDGQWGNGSYTLDGGIMSYTVIDTSTYMRVNEWAEPNVSTPYTIEFRLKLNEVTGSAGAFLFQATTGLVGEYITLSISDNNLTLNRGNVNEVVINTGDNTDDFHVFRVAQENETVQIWRNEVQIGTNLDTMDGAGSNRRMTWLAGHSTIGGEGEIDYYRWTEGAFAAIPEPSSVLLLGVGGLMFALRRKRRQNGYH